MPGLLVFLADAGPQDDQQETSKRAPMKLRTLSPHHASQPASLTAASNQIIDALDTRSGAVCVSAVKQ